MARPYLIRKKLPGLTAPSFTGINGKKSPGIISNQSTLSFKIPEASRSGQILLLITKNQMKPGTACHKRYFMNFIHESHDVLTNIKQTNRRVKSTLL